MDKNVILLRGPMWYQWCAIIASISEVQYDIGRPIYSMSEVRYGIRHPSDVRLLTPEKCLFKIHKFQLYPNPTMNLSRL